MHEMRKQSHRPSDGTHVGRADECSQTKPLPLEEKCNNNTHSQVVCRIFWKRVMGLLTVLAEQMKAGRHVRINEVDKLVKICRILWMKVVV